MAAMERVERQASLYGALLRDNLFNHLVFLDGGNFESANGRLTCGKTPAEN